jgi:hypothetical protein
LRIRRIKPQDVTEKANYFSEMCFEGVRRACFGVWGSGFKNIPLPYGHLPSKGRMIYKESKM